METVDRGAARGGRRLSVRGLVLGKFLPPHRGHLHLIERALREVDELVVLVCSLEREPIPGVWRHAWMRELVPGARVVHVTDENPSEPHEHPRFWEIWLDTIRRHAGGRIDVVFTSERYGDELARRLGARHVMVDEPRLAVPVSGSRIREDPFAHWEHIPEVVRPWFVRRVVVTGSESTGKTTLAAALARRFDTSWSAEYGREYLDAKAAPLDETDVEPIARGQIAAEDEAVRGANRVAVHDTDLISTVVYATHYYGRCPEWIEHAAAERRSDLYLLCDIDVPWVPDPQRDRADRRGEMHALFEEALARFGCRVAPVRGEWAARERTAIEVVAGLMRGPGAP